MNPHLHSFRIEKHPCRIDLPPYAKATVDAHFRMGSNSSGRGELENVPSQYLQIRSMLYAYHWARHRQDRMYRNITGGGTHERIKNL